MNKKKRVELHNGRVIEFCNFLNWFKNQKKLVLSKNLKPKTKKNLLYDYIQDGRCIFNMFTNGDGDINLYISLSENSIRITDRKFESLQNSFEYFYDDYNDYEVVENSVGEEKYEYYVKEISTHEGLKESLKWDGIITLKDKVNKKYEPYFTTFILHNGRYVDLREIEAINNEKEDLEFDDSKSIENVKIEREIKKRQDKVNKILEEFDFETSYKVLKYLERRWYIPNNDVEIHVTEKSLSKKAREVFDNLKTPTYHEFVLRAKKIIEEAFNLKMTVETVCFEARYISESDDVELTYYVDKSFVL